MIIIYAAWNTSVYFALVASINVSRLWSYSVAWSHFQLLPTYFYIYIHPGIIQWNLGISKFLHIELFFQSRQIKTGQIFSDFVFDFEYRYLFFQISISVSSPDLMSILNYRGKSICQIYFFVGPLRLRDIEVPPYTMYYDLFYFSRREYSPDFIFSVNLHLRYSTKV